MRTVLVRAPVRVDLSAGFGDVEPFCLDEPGVVVNASLDMFVELSISIDSSAAHAGHDRPEPFAERMMAWLAGRLGRADPVDFHYRHAGVTSGSGLGSSGALAVACTAGIMRVTGRVSDEMSPPDRSAVARLAIEAERASGVIGGTQDQLASVHGGVGVVRTYRHRTSREPIDAGDWVRDCLLVVHSGGRRSSTDIVSAVLSESSTRRTRGAISEINYLGEQLSQAIARRDRDAVAELINGSRRALGRLNPQIVDPSLAERLGRVRGIVAAKPCGAGGRGTAWVVQVDAPSRRSSVAAELETAGLHPLPARLSHRGVRMTSGSGDVGVR